MYYSSELLNIAIDKMQTYVGRVRGHVLFNQFGQKAYHEGELQQHIPMDERTSADAQIATIIHNEKAAKEQKEAREEKVREYERELLRKADLKEKAIKAHDERMKEKKLEDQEGLAKEQEMKPQKEIEKPVKTKVRDDFEIGGMISE